MHAGIQRQPHTRRPLCHQQTWQAWCRGREGALADLLLVDGNPLENIKLIEDPDKKFLVIMKDGTIYKNALPK